MQSGRGVEAIVQDVGDAIRGLARRPGFSLAAVTTLALAIGATTAVYSLVYGVLLRPLPFQDPDQLVRLWEEHPGGVTLAGNRWLSQRTYQQWVRAPRTLAAIGGYTMSSGVLRGGAEPAAISTASLTPSLIAMMGLTADAGRWFTASDAQPGAPKVIVLSHALWQERFGSRADVVGTALVLDDESYEIVGIAPAWMRFPAEAVQAWRAYRVPTVEEEPRRTFGFNAVARLAPGATPAAVEAEGTAAARSIERPLSAELVFGKGGPVVVHARRLDADTAADVRPALVALAAATGLVLLVACANVANLLLSRGLARQRDFAIRRAVGASRVRLAGQALLESAILSASGGIAGIGLASAIVRVLPLIAPPRLPRLSDVRVDGPVLLVALAATCATAVLSGLLPALRQGGADAAVALRGGDGSVDEGYRTAGARLWRDGLLVFESALAVLLLIGALLVGHSLARLMQVDAGYTPESVITAMISMPQGAPHGAADTASARGAAFVDPVLDQLRGQPTIAAAGAGTSMPMVPITSVTSFPIEPEPGVGEPVMTRAVTYVITPGYAEALGLRLRSGRFFTAGDQRPGIRAVIVNDEFVRRYMRGVVVGRRFPRIYSTEGDVPTEIVGVVGNVLKDGHDREPEPELYFLHRSPTRTLGGQFSIAIRANGDSAASMSLLRQIAARVDPGATIQRADLLSERVASSMAQPRFAAMVLGAFAVLGVTLASAGLVAVLSYTVARRRRELSIRAALGAGRGRLLRMVVADGLIVTGLGLAFGLAAGAGLSRLLTSLLFKVTPLDPFSFAAAPLILLPVAVAASLAPAMRAAAVDPARVLRQD
ncbi:MAG TPA: ABC transporter permease [Vicinamibacterales bacterium]|nr:ABC transporter permease [Vicinamibacterales bacterium]